MNQTTAHHSSSRRKLWKILAALALVGLLIFSFVISQDNRTRQELDEIRKEGYPASLPELNAWYEPAPDSENAAFKVIEACDQLVAPVPSYNGELPISAADKELLVRFLKENQRTLQLAHEAAGLKKSRYSMDLNQGHSVLLPHLARIKQLVVQLRNVAVLHSVEGRPEMAVQSYLDALAVSQSLDPEPLLISQLVRIAGVAIAQTAFERILSQHQLTDAQLSAISSRLHESELSGRASFIRGLAGERCLGINSFQMSPTQVMRLFDQNSTGSTGMAFAALYSLLRIVGISNLDYRFYRQIMQDWIGVSKLDFPEALERAKLTSQQLQMSMQGFRRVLRPLSSMLLPALDRAITKEAMNCCRLRDAQTAVAIERYRLRHSGALPENLDALVPDLMPSLPKDPFGGKSLRFKKLEKGYAVYSVGENGKDDGGISQGLKDVIVTIER